MVGGVVVTQVVGGAVSLVKWLGARTIEREEADKKAAALQVAAVTERLDEVEEMCQKLEHTFDTLHRETAGVMSSIDKISGSVSSITATVDSRIEKQGEWYRKELKDVVVGIEKKLEDIDFKFKQDMARAMYDAQQMAARDAEAKRLKLKGG